MAVTHVQSHTGGTDKTADTDCTFALSANVASGNTLVVAFAVDNFAGSSGTLPAVSSISTPAGETASWVKLGYFDAPTVATGAASVRGELWAITTTQVWNSGTYTGTITISVSRTAKAAAVEEFSGLTTTIRGGSAVSGTSLAGAPTATNTSALSGDLVIGASMWETGTAPTGDSDTTNGSWSTLNGVGSTGGVDLSNVYAAIQYKITTATGSQTYNPTGVSTDSGVVVAALVPAAGTPNGTVSGSFSFVGTARGEGGDVGLLDQFRTALGNRDSSQVNIGIYGASVCEGYPAPPDLWLEKQLADKLRANFNTTGLGSSGGSGYAGIPTLTLENTATSPFSYSVGTFNETLGWGGHHRYWQQGAIQTGICTYTLYDDATRIRLHIIGSNAGASNGGQYRINGGSWVTFNTLTAATQATVLVDIDGTFSSGDTVEIQKTTGTTGPITVHGVSTFNGDESKGILVHNHGHYGYRIQDWNVARSSTDPGYFYQFLNYDLIIMSDWGGNDGGGPGSLSAADFQTSFAEHIDWMRTAGYSGDILISALYNIEAGRTFVDPWSDYVDAMRAVAASKGCAFIQLDAYMPPTPDAIYAPDNVHGNADGSAYDIMTDLWLDKISSTTTYLSDTAAVAETVSITGTGVGSGQGTVSSIIGTTASGITTASPSVSPAVALDASGQLTVQDAAPRAETVTISATGVATVSDAASRSETVSITADGLATALGAGSVAETVSLTATGNMTAEGSAPVDEIATISVTGAGAGSGAVSGVVSISGSGSVNMTETSGVSENVNITMTGAGVGTASVASTVSITSDAAVSQSSTADASPVVTISGDGMVGSSKEADVSESVLVSVNGRVDVTDSAARSESVSITADGGVQTADNASVTNNVDITASGEVAGTNTSTVAVGITGDGSVALNGSVAARDNTVNIDASGNLDAGGISDSDVSVVVSASGQVGVSGVGSVDESVDISATGVATVLGNASESLTISRSVSGRTEGTVSRPNTVTVDVLGAGSASPARAETVSITAAGATRSAASEDVAVSITGTPATEGSASVPCAVGITVSWNLIAGAKRPLVIDTDTGYIRELENTETLYAQLDPSLG
jgi:hypothetical protein